MKVLVGPRLDLGENAVGAYLAQALAGPGGEVISLRQAGIRNLSRPLTRAEVAVLRKALGGSQVHEGSAEVGYLCIGAAPPAPRTVDAPEDGSVFEHRPLSVVAVTDHVNLTWRSPLVGDNDDEVGPRFPSMTGIYAPETVLGRVGEQGGIIVAPGVIAGVDAEERLNAYESEALGAGRYSAVSAEMVPVAIVAAHMGSRMAAAVMTTLACREEEKVSGRS